MVHNEYGKYSGEEAVVDRMVRALSERGHDVRQLRRSTAAARGSLAGQIRGFVSGVYCPDGVRAMRSALAEHRPDVVCVHNLYPFISPAALRECRRAGVPVVMTIHNFRLMCPTGLFMRNGEPCELCLERGNEWGCVRHNCEHSVLKSVGYAARNWVSRVRRHYVDCVDRFVCITDFQRQKLLQAGFAANSLIHIPNAMDVGYVQPPIAEGAYVGFCGRLSREKGIDLIVECARRNPDIPFRLAGECREPELIANLPGNVELVGYLSGEDLQNFYRGARFMVMASRWYEGFPMSIIEGSRYARATVGPDHGGFTEIIGSGPDACGALFTPGSLTSLNEAVQTLWHTPGLAQTLGQNAYRKLHTQYATPVVLDAWDKLLSSLVSC